jgi:formate dehydrogenase assembly factor FdhD
MEYAFNLLVINVTTMFATPSVNKNFVIGSLISRICLISIAAFFIDEIKKQKKYNEN